MVEKITVPLGSRSYPIIIGADVLPSIGERLLEIEFPRRVAVVSTAVVAKLYGGIIGKSLQRAGFEFIEINLPDGEEHKNLQTLESIYDELIKNNFDRGTGLIALGGGVIGDMVGFAAATFLRGIPFAQVPTTLLAQVDSSVGGKTAVNHPLGKNLIGAFYQPEIVLIDVATLSSLEPREVSAGMAEVVKYGVIKDKTFFSWLEKEYKALQNRDTLALIEVVKKSCQIKADIVEVDEKEGSIRAFLNYGHTFGHAVEALSGYGQWKHGEAVSVGMVVAAKIAAERGLCSVEDVQRIIDLLLKLDLPVEPPKHSLQDYVTAMQRDKKVKQGTLTMVLNEGIGKVQLTKIPDIESVFSTILTP
ncbi:3-dehydroquinate synthase [Malonomonas rubra DSM 5091]|uniref:3-dehydroquinate synthase n=1 Tax=Malonomonas rubra DSM 5091 TaxID=1122189 RepID=A0A1M6LJH4_MALRU|nr:3-dehydroquinate synthase [Malonomonas rubra]SHJ71309.1 3-dehydroquinate synthase [Malonomonas rubra DSM 5091]